MSWCDMDPCFGESEPALPPQRADQEFGMTPLWRLSLTLIAIGIAGCSSASLVDKTTDSTRARSRTSGASSIPGQRKSAQATALNEVEQRVAAMVERAVENTPDQLARVRPRDAASSKQARSRALVPSVARHAVTNGQVHTRTSATRSETLQMTDAVGGYCAAVSIASRLAVTALHCVRALCDSGRDPNAAAPSLLGCHVAYGLSNGERSFATVVASSESDLIALLDLNRTQEKYGSLCCDDPRAHDPVYTVSHPGGEPWKVTYGRLSRDPIALEWFGGSSTRVLVAEISTKRGSSGGGLFDIEDNLVGVQVARWSPWSNDFGKAAFIQASRVFSLAGQYCMQAGATACVGLRCISTKYDIWSFKRI